MTELPATAELASTAGSRSSRYPTGPWTAAAAAVCGCAVLAFVDPTEQTVTPPCPFRAATGWWCPLCGGTRAASRLLRGDLGGAFRFNAAVLLLLPVAAVLWAAWAFPGRLNWLDPVRRRAAPIMWTVIGIFVVFTVVRNTPLGDSWLRYPGA